MKFRYLCDPLFLVCFSFYWIHRLAAAVGYSTPLLQAYLNDLVCIGFWIPIMLWGERLLWLRKHDDPPHAYEIVIPLLIWAAVFEVWLPSTRTFAGLAVPDPNDVVCYAFGALAAALFWRWWYRPSMVYTEPSSPGA